MGWNAREAIEACYQLSQPTHRWLAGIVEGVRPLMDEGLGVGAWPFVPGSWTNGARPVGLDNDIGQRMLDTPSLFPPAELEKAFFSTRVGSLSERLNIGNQFNAHPAVKFNAAVGARDFSAVTVWDAKGRGILLVAPAPKPRRIHAATKRTLERLGSHIHAALRLREALENDEAVLATDGRIMHAEGDARSGRARANLRQAVVEMERARTRRIRLSEEEVVDAWRALVDGRWTIVERFDSDGRRLLVARKNPPGAHPNLLLSPMEQHIMIMRAQGLSLKAIQYELGVTVSKISFAIKSGLQKLGLTSEVELANFLGRSMSATSMPNRE